MKLAKLLSQVAARGTGPKNVNTAVNVNKRGAVTVARDDREDDPKGARQETR